MAYVSHPTFTEIESRSIAAANTSVNASGGLSFQYAKAENTSVYGFSIASLIVDKAGANSFLAQKIRVTPLRVFGSTVDHAGYESNRSSTEVNLINLSLNNPSSVTFKSAVDGQPGHKLSLTYKRERQSGGLTREFELAWKAEANKSDAFFLAKVEFRYTPAGGQETGVILGYVGYLPDISEVSISTAVEGPSTALMPRTNVSQDSNDMFVTDVAIVSKGTGYAIGDELELAGTQDSSKAAIKVTAVSTGGKVEGAVLIKAGTGYDESAQADIATTTTGSGSGCKVRFYADRNKFKGDVMRNHFALKHTLSTSSFSSAAKAKIFKGMALVAKPNSYTSVSETDGIFQLRMLPELTDDTGHMARLRRDDGTMTLPISSTAATATIDAGSVATAEFMLVTVHADIDRSSIKWTRLIGGYFEKGNQKFLCVSYDSATRKLAFRRMGPSSGWVAVAAADFEDGGAATSLTLEPMHAQYDSTVTTHASADGSVIYTNSYYAVPTAKIIDNQQHAQFSPQIRIVSSVQEDHLDSGNQTLTLLPPGEVLLREKNTAGDVNTLNSLVLHYGDYNSDAYFTYSNGTFTAQSNTFVPTNQGATSALKDGAAFELHHKTNNSKHITDTVRAVSIDAGGENYADNEVLRLVDGDRNAYVKVGTNDEVTSVAINNLNDTGDVGNHEGYNVDDVLTVPTGGNDKVRVKVKTVDDRLKSVSTAGTVAGSGYGFSVGNTVSLASGNQTVPLTVASVNNIAVDQRQQGDSTSINMRINGKNKTGSGYSTNDTFTLDTQPGNAAGVVTMKVTQVLNEIDCSDATPTVSQIADGSNVNISGQGSNYVVGNTYNVLHSTGNGNTEDTGARIEVTATTDEVLSITAPDAFQGKRGEGYAVDDTITLQTQGSTDPVLTVTEVKDVISGPVVTTVGSGWSVGNEFTRDGARFEVTGVTGIIDTATVSDLNRGSGYRNNEIVTINDGKNDATFKITSVMSELASAAIKTKGEGYANGDILRIGNNGNLEPNNSGTVMPAFVEVTDTKSRIVSAQVNANAAGSDWRPGDRMHITDDAYVVLESGDTEDAITSITNPELSGSGFTDGEKLQVPSLNNLEISIATVRAEAVLSAEVEQPGNNYKVGNQLTFGDATLTLTADDLTSRLDDVEDGGTGANAPLGGVHIDQNKYAMTDGTNVRGSGYAVNDKFKINNITFNGTDPVEYKVTQTGNALYKAAVNVLGNNYANGDTVQFGDATMTLATADLENVVTKVRATADANLGSGYAVGDVLEIAGANDGLGNVKSVRTQQLAASNIEDAYTAIKIDDANLGSGYADGNTVTVAGTAKHGQTKATEITLNGPADGMGDIEDVVTAVALATTGGLVGGKNNVAGNHTWNGTDLKLSITNDILSDTLTHVNLNGGQRYLPGDALTLTTGDTPYGRASASNSVTLDTFGKDDLKSTVAKVRPKNTAGQGSRYASGETLSSASMTELPM